MTRDNHLKCIYLRGNRRFINYALNFSCSISMIGSRYRESCISSLFLPVYNLRTGRVSSVHATGCQTRFTDGCQRHCIVGATFDASQETVVLQSVTLGLSFWRVQCCYVGLCPHPNRPADIRYRLCHLC